MTEHIQEYFYLLKCYIIATWEMIEDDLLTMQGRANNSPHLSPQHLSTAGYISYKLYK